MTAPSVATAPDPAEKHRRYVAMVARVRAFVAATVPPGRTIAVVSKGDPELVRFPAHGAMHLPSTADGRYAGYHPASGEHALELLGQARERGAELLLVPATAAWWLEHYPELRHHLEDRCRLLARDEDTAAVYALGAGAEAAPEGAEGHHPAATATPAPGQLTALVASLLPAGARASVLTEPGARPAADLPRWWPAVPGAALAAQVDALAEAHDHLVVPAADRQGALRRREVVAAVARRARVVTDQPAIGAILELRPLPAARPPVPAAAAATDAAVEGIARVVLPPGAPVAVAEPLPAGVRLGDRAVVRLPADPGEGWTERLRERGVHHVLAPAATAPVPAAGRARTIWADRHCRVLRLDPLAA